MAYACHQREKYDRESRWLAAYFELYRGMEFILTGMTGEEREKIMAYGEKATRLFPYIFDVSFIANSLREGGPPPGTLTLCLDIGSPAHYKLSADGRVLKGGFLRSGENNIDLEMFTFFEKSADHAYRIQLKAEHLIFEQKIVIRELIEAPVPEKTPSAVSPSAPSYFQISLYLEDRLLALSRKTSGGIPEMRFDIPPAELHYRPFIIKDKERTPPSGFPILAPLALAYQLFKKVKEERQEESGPPVEIIKARRVERNFRKSVGHGDAVFFHAVLTLETRTLSLPPVLSRLSTEQRSGQRVP